MEALPTFELFPEPLREEVFESTAETCGCCNRARGFKYTLPTYGGSDETDDIIICPWCIADGTAAALDITFNDGTIYPALESMSQLNAADLELVEQRTPGFVTWQGNRWTICCGRACIYLGEADSSDLKGRWRTAVPSMFAGDDWSKQEIAEIINNMVRGGSPSAYVFQCQTCRKLQGYWDCD